MGAIYNMTTINYDYLFASLLKKTWYRSLDHNFLKRRIFLIISELLSRHDIYLHDDLMNDQTDLNRITGPIKYLVNPRTSKSAALFFYRERAAIKVWF